MNEFSEELLNSSLNYEKLGKLTRKEGISNEERDAIASGMRALEFALKPERRLQFSDYLINWPPELTPEQEARIKAIEEKMSDEEKRIAGFEE